MQTTKYMSKLNIDAKINQIKLLNNNSLFVEKNGPNNFIIFPDCSNKEKAIEFSYNDYEPKSHIYHCQNQLYSISKKFFNIWNIKDLEKPEISEKIDLDVPNPMDASLNFNKEFFLVLWKNNQENLLKVSGFPVKNLQKNLGLKLKRKQSEIEAFTFYQSRKIGETLNLSQFLMNSKEKEKFQQMDYIYEVIILV